MDNEKIIKAFNYFTDDRYTDSEKTIRSEIRQTVNDHLKDKLGLSSDPITKDDDD